MKVCEQMGQLARDIGHAFTLAYGLHFVGWSNYFCRRAVEMERAASEEISIAREQGFSLWHGAGLLNKGAALLLQGELEEAIALLEEGLSAYRSTGAAIGLPHYLSTLGDAYTRAGRFDDARQALEEGLRIARENDEGAQHPELHRLLGELSLVEATREAVAEGCFRRAIDTARRQDSKLCELRATTSLARLWQRQDRRDEARLVLAAAYDRYTEGLTIPDLADARELLDSLR